jgi:ribosome biogenesis GTPase / thiamine phosphate phosphatase
MRDNRFVELEALGWDDGWDAAFDALREDGLLPGRVAAQHRGAYDVLTAEGESRASISARLRRGSTPVELPVVGDWVGLDGDGVVHSVLPRRTAFSRRAPRASATEAAREQVIAANVDVIFVVASFDQELDRLQLERYVALTLQSGARPVLLLTKADLEPSPAAIVDELAAIGEELPVHAVSVRTSEGLGSVRAYLADGVTGALLGPSGAGKSTLVNTLVGDDDLLATGAVRPDGAGRHTTTRRQLVLLPGGGLLIDNPGMREAQLWTADEGLAGAFPDIAELAALCAYSDCRHETEPGCAIRAALEDGRLPAERWQRYSALDAELTALSDELAERERRGSRRR